MTRVGIVTGLIAEARLARRKAVATDDDGPLIACSGPGRGRQSAEDLLSRGARALISFGLAGGLDPWLKPGDLVCPEQVLTGTGALSTHSLWRERISTEARMAGLTMAEGALLGSDAPVASTLDKHMRAHESGAVAVDMESHDVATVAASRGLPFIALRAVADSAERSLPPAALAGVDAEGRTRAGRVLLALCLSPGQIPAMIGLARDSRAGMAALGRAAGFGSLVLGLL